VTPDGRNALSDSDGEILLRALNSEKVLDTVLNDVNYKGGLQDWIARHDALFLELCKARGVIIPDLPNDIDEPRLRLARLLPRRRRDRRGRWLWRLVRPVFHRMQSDQ
jgi:hypothetical protein